MHSKFTTAKTRTILVVIQELSWCYYKNQSLFVTLGTHQLGVMNDTMALDAKYTLKYNSLCQSYTGGTLNTH